MYQKVSVITGASSGIGFVTAGILGRMGYRLILVSRNPARGAAALARLRADCPAIDARFIFADLSMLAEIKRLGAELAASEPRIDLLINNAGGISFTRKVTADGLEQTFAVNHMAYFILTGMLIDSLKNAAPARIVNVASAAHRRVTLDFDDLQHERRYSGWAVYSRSKLANILFTRRLARNLADTGITVNAVHPGFVRTAIGDDNPPFAKGLVGIVKRLFADSVESGADKVVHAATSLDIATVTGAYFVNSHVALPTKAARDDLAADRLWAISERLATGVGSD